MDFLKYVVLKGARDLLVAGTGAVVITFVFREATGDDPSALPTFVAALAVWRVIRGRMIAALDALIATLDNMMARVENKIVKAAAGE